MHLESVRARVGAAAACCDPKVHNRPTSRGGLEYFMS